MSDAMPQSHLRASLAEGRARVFGAGLDLSFRIILAIALICGAVAFSRQAGPGGLTGLVAGLASAAFFLAMPFVTTLAFATLIAFFSRPSLTDQGADPPMPVVLVAFAGTIGILAALVAGVSYVPVVGAQLRSIFA